MATNIVIIKILLAICYKREILDMLGDDPSLDKSFGETLHEDIASRCEHTSKEKRADRIKEYLPPENCPHLKDPA